MFSSIFSKYASLRLFGSSFLIGFLEAFQGDLDSSDFGFPLLPLPRYSFLELASIKVGGWEGNWSGSYFS